MVPVPLIIGPDEKVLLQQLRELAALHPVDMPALMERLKTVYGRFLHRQQMNKQTVRLPSALAAAFFVTFSIEVGHPCGTARHMSMSVKREDLPAPEAQDRVPHPVGVEMVAAEFGFAGGLEACAVWRETLSDGGVAINVLQPIAAAAAEELVS
jgi:hypothetical protein